MPFATVEQAETSVGLPTLRDVCDDDKDGIYDRPVVVAGIAAASSKVESYIHNFMPLAYVSDALVQATLAIAMHEIRLPRNMATEASKAGYDNAIKWLTDVSKGLAQLVPPGSGTPSPETIDPGDPELYAQPRMWSRTLSRGAF